MKTHAINYKIDVRNDLASPLAQHPGTKHDSLMSRVICVSKDTISYKRWMIKNSLKTPTQVS